MIKIALRISTSRWITKRFAAATVHEDAEQIVPALQNLFSKDRDGIPGNFFP
jgi:hypothetical protein